MSPVNKTIAISINTAWNIYHFRGGLMQFLQARGYRIITAAPPDTYSAKLREKVAAHHDLPMDNAGTSPLKDALLCWRYMLWLRRTRPDVLLTYTAKPNIYGVFAARLLGIPVIANVAGLGTAFIHEGWVTHVVKMLYRLALRCTAHVFFQNAEDHELFLKLGLVDAAKTSLIPGSGIDLTFFAPQPMVDHAPHVDFVLVARLLKDKGIGEYVAAAQRVKATHPQARFRLVGPRGVKNQTAIDDTTLDRWVTEGVIEYLGASDQVRDIMAAHDCVVLPSYREGMSRTLIEAAALAKPIITTDVPGCRQIVTDGENGLLCTARDADSLAQAMIRLIEMPPAARAQMGAHSRDRAERLFDEQIVFTAYLQQIEKCVSK